MRATKTLMLSVVLAVPVAEASRLVCENTTFGTAERVQQNFEQADVVLLGSVTATKSTTIDYVELFESKSREGNTTSSMSMAQLLDRIQTDDHNVSQEFFQSADITATKYWKGQTPESIVVVNYSVPGLYGFNLLEGESYLIFSRKLDDGSYTASTICATTIPAKVAEEQIKILDNLVSGTIPSK